jgi:hypothetical protein
MIAKLIAPIIYPSLSLQPTTHGQRKGRGENPRIPSVGLSIPNNSESCPDSYARNLLTPALA